jgi:endonuclease/exonuclease/phosphatase family metal-dependent hydrolase
MPPRRNALPLALALMFSGAACAPIRNYTDHAGPRYAGGAPSAGPAHALRLVTFNIRFARQIAGSIELLRANPQLRSADVIALQEMDSAGVERIARALGLAYVYYPAATRADGKDFGNAVLVRGRIEEDHKLVLPHPGRFGGMQRIAVAVTAEVAGRRLRVYSTHLGTPKDVSAAARREQVAAILRDARGADVPVLVAGDFNNRDAVARAFQDAGFDWATREVGRTIAVFSWDHVFLRGVPASPALRSGAADSRGASDHRAVWVELPLPASAP